MRPPQMKGARGKLTLMRIKLRRYGWRLLLLVAIAGLASWSLWPNVAVRVMRQKYDRIRIGMTRSEVAEIMGAQESKHAPKGTWRGVAHVTSGSDELPLELPHAIIEARAAEQLGTEDRNFWCDGSAAIFVIYVNDRGAIEKYMDVRVPYWEQRVRVWLRRLGFSIP